jgi:hypothetical protein
MTRADLARQGIQLIVDEASFIMVDPNEAGGAELVIHADGAENCL